MKNILIAALVIVVLIVAAFFLSMVGLVVWGRLDPESTYLSQVLLFDTIFLAFAATAGGFATWATIHNRIDDVNEALLKELTSLRLRFTASLLTDEVKAGIADATTRLNALAFPAFVPEDERTKAIEARDSWLEHFTQVLAGEVELNPEYTARVSRIEGRFASIIEAARDAKHRELAAARAALEGEAAAIAS